MTPPFVEANWLAEAGTTADGPMADPRPISNSAFLQAVYGRLRDDYGWTTSFAADPNAAPPSVWAGSPWFANDGQCALIDQRGADNTYYCVAVMRPSNPKARNALNFGRLAVLVADDPDLDELIGQVSYQLETSPGKFQIGILLDPEDPDTRDAELVSLVLKEMVTRKVVALDPSGNSHVRYVRLPHGSNTKRRDSGPFQTKMLSCDLSSVFSLADAVAAFGLDLDDIRRGVGKAKVAPAGKAVAGDASNLFRALINPDLGQRSYHDALLKISASWVASGMHKGAVVNQLRSMMAASKPEGDAAQLERWQTRVDDIPRMVDGAEKYAPEGGDTPWISTPDLQAKAGTCALVRGDEVEPEPIDWLWNGWLAAGKLHIIGGQPETGKTTIAIAIAATFSSGGLLPDGSRAPLGDTLVWSGEDDFQDTILPRFIANGGARERLHHITGRYDGTGVLQPFDPANDITALVTAAKGLPDLRLIVIDPVVSVVSGDSHKNTEVRRAMQPLVQLAEQAKAAILGITHLSKGTAGRDPIERITGSLAFAALPRLIWGTAKSSEPGQPSRLVRVKSNIGPGGNGFEYDLVQTAINLATGLMGQKVEWGAALEGSAKALIAELDGPEDPGRVSALGAAKAWLVEMLGTGTVRVTFIEEMAKEKGHAWPTVKRAKTALGVESIKQGSECWAWQMPKVIKA